MGKRVGSSTDPVQHPTNAGGEGMVDNQKTTKQRVPRVTGINWTRILAERGLETPGYHETIDLMKRNKRI